MGTNEKNHLLFAGPARKLIGCQSTLAVETPLAGVKKVQQLAETISDEHHRYKGFNLLTQEDASLFRLLLRGEFVISGFSNKNLRQHLPNKNSGQITRLLKRLRVHRLICAVDLHRHGVARPQLGFFLAVGGMASSPYNVLSGST